jgi:hypothetical protein
LRAVRAHRANLHLRGRFRRAVFFEKVARQQFNIFAAAFTKRRQFDSDDAQTVKEIGAKLAARD